MELIDFEYAGQRLSDMGLMMCSFGTTGDETTDIGNVREMNNVKSARADIYYSVGSSYSDTFAPTFSICKNPCVPNTTDYFTEEEVHQIVRWLNRPKYEKFVPIYDDGSFSDVYFMVTFNLTLEKAAGKVAGFNLEFMTNAPYGFQEPVTVSYQGVTTFTITDESDEIGAIWPEMTITCKESGDLSIASNQMKYNSLIKGCTAEETITFSGLTKQISTNKESHKDIHKGDFNFIFPFVGNTYSDRTNTFTFSIPVDVTLTYSPIRKVGIV
ncbi:phage tail domain-containing protein [Faecalibaculum rodentium]|uniref:phage tail domain-containing protein n=1 Tax=Faecalibaculum rodentium TaxID=1702221 RepID=UPI0027315124|nr:phage tail domain-containing protein [Faecalibaculum rodentium]